MTLSAETYLATVARVASDALASAKAREDRMVAHVEAHGCVDVEAIATSIARDVDRAITGTGEARIAGAAARVTSSLTDRGVACAHALDREQTGAIKRGMMRVRGSRPSGLPSSAPTVAADTVLLRSEQARRVACSDLRALVRDMARTSGAHRKSVINKINLIVRDWSADETVISLARSLGWRV